MVRRVQLDVDTKVDRIPIVMGTKAVGELGDSFDDAGKDAAQLDRRLESTGRKVKELAREISRASNEIERADLEKAFGNETRTLAKLRRIRAAIDEVGDEARETSREVAKMGVAAGASFGAGGAKAGSAFAGLFSRAVGSPLLLALVGAGIAAAPLIGAAVGGAIVGGVGVGGVVGGLVAGAQSPKVKSAFAELGKELQQDLITAGEQTFAGPMVEAAEKFRQAWRSEVGTEVKRTLAEASKLLDPLVDAGIGFVREALPGIRRAIAEAGPFFDMLADEIPKVGRVLGESFALMAEHSDAIAVGFRDVLAAVDATAATAALLVTYLSESWRIARTFTPITLFSDMGELGGGMQRKMGAVRSEVETTTSSLRTQRTVMLELADAYRTAFGQTLSVEQASIDFERAMRALKDSVKENGKSLDETKVKGAANRQALLDLAAAAVAVRDANLKNNMTYPEANKQFEASRQRILNLAAALGIAESEAKDLIDRLLGIKSKEAKITVKFVSDTSGYHPPRVGPGVTVGFREGGIARAQTGLITDKPAVLFGERGTGREGFVPERGISRRRAAGLLSEMASWHDMAVVPKRSAGYMSLPPTTPGRAARTEVVVRFDFRNVDGDFARAIRRLVISDGGGSVQAALGQPMGR